jgi:hypothetical protein
VKFVVGHDDGALAAEAEEFGDILFVDVPESYDNLNLKLLAAMKIVHACYEYRFVFHADDDSFVRIDLLLPERAWLVCAGLVVWLVSCVRNVRRWHFPFASLRDAFLAAVGGTVITRSKCQSALCVHFDHSGKQACTGDTCGIRRTGTPPPPPPPPNFVVAASPVSYLLSA